MSRIGVLKIKQSGTVRKVSIYINAIYYKYHHA
jgi:hypothetical protein